MNYTVEDFINELSKLPKDTQIRVREFIDYSQFDYKLSEPTIVQEWENGEMYSVII